MRFVVVGAGAIGGVVGGYLARARRDVLLVARGAHRDAIQRDGLRVESPDATFVVRTPACGAADVSWRASDVAFVATKVQDVAAVLAESGAPSDVPVVCLTNGLEAERVALRTHAHVLGACVWMPATHLTPGVVQVWASPRPGAIDLGRAPDGRHELAPTIAHALADAGFASEASDDIMRWKRGKLLTNLMNGAEALCGPAARRAPLAERARAEARACFDAAGLSCTSDDEDATRRAGFESKPIGDAKRGGGSTWQSLVRGRALEIDHLNGEITLLGRLHGVATPVNEFLQRFVTVMSRGRIAPGSFPLDDLLAAAPM